MFANREKKPLKLLLETKALLLVLFFDSGSANIQYKHANLLWRVPKNQPDKDILMGYATFQLEVFMTKSSFGVYCAGVSNLSPLTPFILSVNLSLPLVCFVCLYL